MSRSAVRCTVIFNPPQFQSRRVVIDRERVVVLVAIINQFLCRRLNKIGFESDNNNSNSVIREEGWKYCVCEKLRYLPVEEESSLNIKGKQKSLSPPCVNTIYYRSVSNCGAVCVWRRRAAGEKESGYILWSVCVFIKNWVQATKCRVPLNFKCIVQSLFIFISYPVQFSAVQYPPRHL